MNRNKEYRLKRKNQRKDYIIQDKNIKLKTMYYQNKIKNEKIEKLKKENKKLKDVVAELEDRLIFKLGKFLNEKDYVINDEDLVELLKIIDRWKKDGLDEEI